MTDTRGFTLLEVLIAITILAIGAAVISGGLGQSFRQISTLEKKTFAVWAAENKLTELHAAHQWLNPGESDETITMGGHAWQLHVRVAPTGNPAMRQVTASVTLPGDTATTATQTGFIGKY